MMSKRAIFACSVATLALGFAPAVLAKSSGRIPRTPPSASQLAPTTLHPEAGRGLGRSYTGNAGDVTQFHYDAGRTGWNPTETDLTPATVKSRSFGLLASFAVDDNVFAQPLLVTNYEMPNGALHDVLVIATGTTRSMRSTRTAISCSTRSISASSRRPSTSTATTSCPATASPARR